MYVKKFWDKLKLCYTLKILAETCVQRRCEQVSQSGVHVTQWNSRFCHHCDRCNRCRSRKRFYFWWNLSRNRSSKSFTKPTMLHGATPVEHVSHRNTVAQKFQLKVSTCNSGFKQKKRTRITQSEKNCTINCAIHCVRVIWKQKIWLAICEFLWSLTNPNAWFVSPFCTELTLFCTGLKKLHCS